MMSSMQELPAGWQTLRGGKNWLCPKGRKYKEWHEVQEHFQLLNFEEDIPGLECRPENARKELEKFADEITLEEAAKKDEEKSRKGRGKKRPNGNVTDAGENSGTKKNRKKVKDEDPDYHPEDVKVKKEKSTSPNKIDKSTKAEADANSIKSHTPITTLEEISDVKSIDGLKKEMKEESIKHNINKNVLSGSTISVVKMEVEELKDKSFSQKKEEESKFEIFSQFCKKLGVNPVTASSNIVEKFLMNLQKERNLSKQLISSYKSEIVKTQTESKKSARTATNSANIIIEEASKGASKPGQRSGSSKLEIRPVVGGSSGTATSVRSTLQQQSPIQSGQGRQSTPQQVRQANPQQVRQATPQQVRQATPQQVRQATPQQYQVRQSTPRAATRPPAPRQAATPPARAQTRPPPSQLTELPPHLRSKVSFPCRLEGNAGGGASLYRAAAQHCSLGQEGWAELRRYCHTKLAEWWQWYQPYYTFPLQLRIKQAGGTVQRRLASPAEFVKFLRTEDALETFFLSECELYCLANILGVPIHLLTFSRAAGLDSKWETLDPHQSLVHQNKFTENKEDLYLLHEDKVQFSRIVKK